MENLWIQIKVKMQILKRMTLKRSSRMLKYQMTTQIQNLTSLWDQQIISSNRTKDFLEMFANLESKNLLRKSYSKIMKRTVTMMSKLGCLIKNRNRRYWLWILETDTTTTLKKNWHIKNQNQMSWVICSCSFFFYLLFCCTWKIILSLITMAFHIW